MSGNNKRPIGIFDSGVGGLTVFSEIRKRFPSEDLIYFGDTARVPYGPKSDNTIREYSVQNARFLNGFRVKLIVVACNTSSAIALDFLKKHFNVPVIGVIEPGAGKAVKATLNGNIGIIGTEGTINSNAYPQAIHKLNGDITTHSYSCPLFVPLVEEGWHNHPAALTIAAEYLNPLLKKEIDTLVLGCTHYPMIKNTIKQITGDSIRLIDSACSTADYLLNYLPQSSKPTGKDMFFVSDNQHKFIKLASRILAKKPEKVHIVKLGEGWYIDTVSL